MTSRRHHPRLARRSDTSSRYLRCGRITGRHNSGEKLLDDDMFEFVSGVFFQVAECALHANLQYV